MYYCVKDTELSSIADAIRNKKQISYSLSYPADYIDELQTFNNDTEKIFLEGTYSYVYDSSCTNLRNWAFACNNSITSVDFPNCSTIGSSAFDNCYYLSSISFPNATNIGSYAFRTNSVGFSSASFPECLSVGAMAFAYCYQLSEIYLPKCTSLNSSVFYSCGSLKRLYLPEISTGLNTYTNLISYTPKEMDYLCLGITSVVYSSSLIGNLSSMGHYFSIVELPSCPNVGQSCFKSYTSANTVLRFISLPECSYIAQHAFYRCTNLSSLYTPKVTYISSSAFYSCQNLKTISLPECSYIGRAAFSFCARLESIYLFSTEVTKINSSGVFYMTPLEGGIFFSVIASVYVPASLLTAYKTDEMWSYYADRFVGV